MIKRMNDFGIIYSDEKYFSAYKKIRNQIRRYNSEELISACIRALHNTNLDEIDRLKQLSPWLILLLLKWCISDRTYNTAERIHLSQTNFRKLVNKMHWLEGEIRMPRQFGSVQLFLRAMRYQQFWLQELPKPGQIARQHLLFGKLNLNHSFQSWFKDAAGLSINQAIELSIFTTIRFLDMEQIWIEPAWFDQISHAYPDGTIEAFLGTISCSIEEAEILVENL